jgi:hypothetical protein
MNSSAYSDPLSIPYLADAEGEDLSYPCGERCRRYSSYTLFFFVRFRTYQIALLYTQTQT